MRGELPRDPKHDPREEALPGTKTPFTTRQGGETGETPTNSTMSPRAPAGSEPATRGLGNLVSRVPPFDPFGPVVANAVVVQVVTIEVLAGAISVLVGAGGGLFWLAQA